MIENLVNTLQKLNFHNDNINPQLVICEKAGNKVKLVNASHRTKNKESCISDFIKALKEHDEDTSFLESSDYSMIYEYTGHIGENVDFKLKF